MTASDVLHVLGAAFNLANAALGAGVLAYAYAFSVAGLLLGFFLSLGIAIIMTCTLLMLARVNLVIAHDPDMQSRLRHLNTPTKALMSKHKRECVEGNEDENTPLLLSMTTTPRSRAELCRRLYESDSDSELYGSPETPKRMHRAHRKSTSSFVSEGSMMSANGEYVDSVTMLMRNDPQYGDDVVASSGSDPGSFPSPSGAWKYNVNTASSDEVNDTKVTFDLSHGVPHPELSTIDDSVLGDSPRRYLPTLAASYEELILRAFGERVSRAVVVCIVLTLIGAITAAFIIVGESIRVPLVYFLSAHGVLDGLPHFVTTQWFLTILPVCLICLPLGCLRSIRSLRYTGFMAFACVMYIAVMISIRYFYPDTLAVTDGPPTPALGHMHGEGVVSVRWSVNVLMALPVFVYALGCHLQVVPIQYELPNSARSVKLISMAAICSPLMCFSLYSVVGWFGYSSFGTQTCADLLLNYEPHDVLANVARLFIGLIVILSYPILNFPLRTAIEYLLFRHSQPSLSRVRLTTVITCTVSLVVSIVFPKIQIIFGIIGATAGCFMFLVLPGRMFAKFHGVRSPMLKRICTALGHLTCIAGILLGVVCTVVVVINTIHQEQQARDAVGMYDSLRMSHTDAGMSLATTPVEYTEPRMFSVYPMYLLGSKPDPDHGTICHNGVPT